MIIIGIISQILLGIYEVLVNLLCRLWSPLKQKKVILKCPSWFYPLNAYYQSNFAHFMQHKNISSFALPVLFIFHRLSRTIQFFNRNFNNLLKQTWNIVFQIKLWMPLTVPFQHVPLAAHECSVSMFWGNSGNTATRAYGPGSHSLLF